MYLSIVSLLFGALHALAPRSPLKHVYEVVYGKEEDLDYLSSADTSQLDVSVIQSLDVWGRAIQTCRLAACLALLGISVYEVDQVLTPFGSLLLGFYVSLQP